MRWRATSLWVCCANPQHIAVRKSSHKLRLTRRGVELDCLLARTLPGTCVGTCTLAADRQSAPVTDSPVRAEVHQALDVHGHFAAQVTLDRELRDLRADGIHLRLGEVLHLGARIHASALAGRACTCPSYAVNVRKPDPHVLVHRNVDTGYACHAFTLAAVCGADLMCRSPGPPGDGERSCSSCRSS